MTDLTRAELLKGAPERRGISEFEIREGKSGLLEFEGYAAVWDQPYEVNDQFGAFTEIVERNALARTLSRNPDVILNINHGRDGALPLARTTSGTLRVATDTHGLIVRAGLDARNPRVQEIHSVLDRKDAEDMSWAFRVTVDEWTTADDSETRVIREVNIDGGDVSIVTTGANRGTAAHPLRDALLALADPDIDHKILAECRAEGFDLDVIRKNLATLTERASRKTMSIRAAERALEL